MFYFFILTLLALVFLLLSGDLLIKGAVGVAERLGIPKLIVGLTIVAFGTSAPELVISIRAVLDGVSGLAIGNVVGSNIANVLLVLGLPAAIFGLPLIERKIRRTYLIMLGSTLLFVCICFFWELNRSSGIILIVLFLIVILDSIISNQKRFAKLKHSINEVEVLDKTILSKQILLLLLGLVGLPLSANIFVDNAINIANGFGVSEVVIGLTMVAIGTSLPELSTMFMAIIRKEKEMALGNIIGSNLFNLLGVIGISSFISNITIPNELLQFDLWLMVCSAFLLAPIIFRPKNLNRIWGLLFIMIYLAYIILVINRGL
ncbi:MAG: calcium/sodium antiporter [Paracoccaceae bacterium]